MSLRSTGSLFGFSDRLIPAWTRTAESSAEIAATVKKALASPFVSVREFSRLSKEPADAFLLTASDLPQNTRQFVALLGRLAAGGKVIMEVAPARWRRSELKEMAASMSARLKFLGPAEQLGLTGSAAKFAAIIEKERLLTNEKKLTILLPLQNGQEEHPRVREWLENLHHHNLFLNMELILIFDGMDDLLPAWKEYPLAEAEESLQTIRHFRSFGKEEALLSGSFFARSKRILWDGSREISSWELFPLVESMIDQDSREPAVSIAWAIPDKGGGRESSFQSSFALFNRPAIELIRRQNYYQDRSNLFKEGLKKLEKHGARIQRLPAYWRAETSL